MSVITPLLRASARSAYRDLFRAASSTFKDDETVLNAFRQKMRRDALPGSRPIDPDQYQQQIQLTRDVAQFLRSNVVQAVKVTESSHPGPETWKLNLRSETELGSNDTIRSPAAADSTSSRSAKKRERAAYSDTSPNHSIPIHYSALKVAHKERRIPILHEKDIEESFVRVVRYVLSCREEDGQLLHKPTGIRVSCQETRSLSTNRMLARRLLLERLDQQENPGLTKNDLKRAKQKERERQRRRKTKKKAIDLE